MDNAKNFAKVTVSTGYDASATSIVLTSGHASRLPTPPFNATWWNSTDFPDPSDDSSVEIVRVTAIASDTLTVTRAQESTIASTKNTASKMYKMVAGLTAKVINTDLMTLGPQVLNGRLTLESGVPVSSTSQTAKTTVYFTPFEGNRISLYDGANWNTQSFTEISVALGTLADATNYDVFIYSNAGTPTLELSAAWASATTRTTTITLQDGVYVKSGATTRRYLGTFRTTSTTTTEDSLTKRFLWNFSNQKARDLWKRAASSHSYDGTHHPWNSDTTNRVEFVTGLALTAGGATIAHQQSTGSAGFCSIALDSITAEYRNCQIFMTVSGITGLSMVIEPLMGYHYLQVLEGSVGAVTFEAFSLTATMAA